MKHDHDKRKPARVAEPVQVYLGPEERERLARLTEELDTTKSDVLRRGLEALERQLTDPAEHPALRIVGLFETDGAAEGADVAVGHDRFLADSEVESWSTRDEGAS